MRPRLSIFVVDTGPLITLAVAEALDTLLHVNVSLIIPDAVLYEATKDSTRLGATDILDWVTRHTPPVELAATQAFLLFDAARDSVPGLRRPNLGEQAAVEVIEQPHRLQGEERGVLLCEESAILRRVSVRDRTRIVEVSTLDYLRLLEAEQRIQSADELFQRAAEAGRMASRVERLAAEDQTTRNAVRRLIGDRRG
jgi:hypothetical protein